MSNTSLHKEECDFMYLIMSKMFYLIFFIYMKYHLSAKYKTEKHVVRSTFFQILTCKSITEYCFVV